MPNEQNLIKNADRTPTERKENARRAGLASVEARRKRKLLKECLDILLEKEVSDKNGNTMTGAEAMAVKVFQQALKGDLKAFEIVRDTAGQKPVDKVQMKTDVNIADSAERLSNIFDQIKEEK